MLLYKNHRFHFANVSFQIPEGYFLDTDPEENANNCIRLWNPDRHYSVEVRVDDDSKGSEMELAYVLQGMKPKILHPIRPININGLSGHHATYRNTRTQYYEMWLNIDVDRALLILIVTKDDILKLDVATVISAIDPQVTR